MNVFTRLLIVLCVFNLYAMEIEEQARQQAKEFMDTYNDLIWNKKDSQKAQAYLKEAQQEENCYKKAIALGLLGDGEKNDYAKALTYYEQILPLNISPAGKAIAYGKIADIYSKGGNGIQQDYTKALTYLEQAAAYPRIRTTTKTTIENKQKKLKQEIAEAYAKTLAYLEQLACQNTNSNAAIAQINLGFIYGMGIGVEKDYTRAQTYLEQAAQQDINRDIKIRAEQLLQELKQVIEAITEKPAAKRFKKE